MIMITIIIIIIIIMIIIIIIMVLNMTCDIELLQKVCLLGSARILRRVLDM